MSVFSSEENSSYIVLLQRVRKSLKRSEAPLQRIRKSLKRNEDLLQRVRKPLKVSEPPLQRVRNPLKVSEPPPRLKNSLAIVVTYHFIKLTKLVI